MSKKKDKKKQPQVYDEETLNTLRLKTLLELEGVQLDIEAKKIEIENARLELRANEKEKELGVSERRIVRLSDTVDDESVGIARAQLYEVARLYPGEDITLDINSGGGSVYAGLELFGVLRELSGEGHKIITRIGGIAGSMAGVLSQAGDVRQIRKGSYLHLHEGAWGSIGKASDMMDDALHIEKITKDICAIYANRTTKKKKWTAEKIHERIKRQEWYLTAEEALEAGFVDVIV